MGNKELDLTVQKNADASRNVTVLGGVVFMNIVLALAYLVEVIKGARSVASYAVVAVIAIATCVFAIITYLKKNDAKLIRYICGGGFLLLYGYIMFTTATELPFCYVLVVLSVFTVYIDVKFSVGIGVVALLINIGVLAKNAVTVGLTSQQITNAEIMLACILMVCVFSVLAIKKVEKINNANLDKADAQRDQSEKLLKTTLDVASVITDNITTATAETENLNGAIGATQQAMEELTKGTNEAAQAIEEQQKNTEKINGYIREVEGATGSIVNELENAQEKLKQSSEVMSSLLEQVKVSETSSGVVAKEMEGLKDNAGKMQTVMGLISSIANQTGMLALNASIEAARAGEAGKGFAVVASEISNLAAQTNTATGDINKLIQNITESIEEVAKAVDAMLECNKLQNEYVDQTAEKFEQIHASTQEISGQAEQLKTTVDAVLDVNKQVSASIENVSALTEEVTASASETLESCNMNLESIATVSGIMETLATEAEKLKQD